VNRDHARPAAIITGASSGIGAATAELLASRRYNLVLGARRLPALEALALDLARRFGTEAVALACDVRCEEDVQRLVDVALERFGRLDVLVNNAGIGLYGRVEDTTAEDFRDALETNVMGVHHGIRAAVPVMRRQGFGHIVNVGSVVGKRSWPYHGAYAASKFALVGLTQALRAELAGSGVSATLVLPATTATPFFENARATGYVPRPIGPVQPAAAVARRIVRSISRASPEVHAVPLMRVGFVLAEAFPGLADRFAARSYRRSGSHRRGPPPGKATDQESG
jgi:short-subunit dehydrogenase